MTHTFSYCVYTYGFMYAWPSYVSILFGTTGRWEVIFDMRPWCVRHCTVSYVHSRNTFSLISLPICSIRKEQHEKMSPLSLDQSEVNQKTETFLGFSIRVARGTEVSSWVTKDQKVALGTSGRAGQGLKGNWGCPGWVFPRI